MNHYINQNELIYVYTRKISKRNKKLNIRDFHGILILKMNVLLEEYNKNNDCIFIIFTKNIVITE